MNLTWGMNPARSRAVRAALCVVAVAVAAPALVQAMPLTYQCACVGTPDDPGCGGGGGIAGPHDQVRAGIPAGQVAFFYRPATSTGQAGSGWSCLAEGGYTCLCAGGSPGRRDCGNQAVAGDRGEQHVALPVADVLKNYGPGRIGGERTGWICVLTDVWTR